MPDFYLAAANKSGKLLLLILSFLVEKLVIWSKQWSKCTSEEDVGCPCESGWNKFICCDTDECVNRSNWQQVSSISSSLSSASSSVKINNTVMGDTTMPIQNIPLADQNATVRCMFDNCSQATFIHMKTAQKVYLTFP